METTSNTTLCCHWCNIPLGCATRVTYLNGNLPICDRCLGIKTPTKIVRTPLHQIGTHTSEPLTYAQMEELFVEVVTVWQDLENGTRLGRVPEILEALEKLLHGLTIEGG